MEKRLLWSLLLGLVLAQAASAAMYFDRPGRAGQQRQQQQRQLDLELSELLGEPAQLFSRDILQQGEKRRPEVEEDVVIPVGDDR